MRYNTRSRKCHTAQVELQKGPDKTTNPVIESEVETIRRNTRSKKRQHEEVQTCDPSIIPAAQRVTRLKKKAKKATSRDDSRHIKKVQWVAATDTPTPVSCTRSSVRLKKKNATATVTTKPDSSTVHPTSKKVKGILLVDGDGKCRKKVHVCFAEPISEGAKPDPISEVQPDMESLSQSFSELQTVDAMDEFKKTDRLERANPASADFDTQLEDTETTAEEEDFVTDRLEMTGASDENLEGLDSVTVLIERPGVKLQIVMCPSTLLIVQLLEGSDPRLRVGFALQGHKTLKEYRHSLKEGLYPLEVTFAKPTSREEHCDSSESFSLHQQQEESEPAIDHQHEDEEPSIDESFSLHRLQEDEDPATDHQQEDQEPAIDETLLSTEDLLRLLDPTLATLAKEDARLMQQRDKSQDLVHVPQQPVPWQRNRGSVYNDTELNEIGSILNETGQQQVLDEVEGKRKKKNIQWHERPNTFSQVKGSKTFDQAKRLHKQLWRLFGMATPEDELDGRSTVNWPRFIPAILYVDQIIDAPKNGGKWPGVGLCKASKDRVLVGCFDASSVSLLKETLGRASAANWKSDDNIDVEFVFSAQSMKDKWRRKDDGSTGDRHMSSPTADAAHGNLQNPTPSMNDRMDFDLY